MPGLQNTSCAFAHSPAAAHSYSWQSLPFALQRTQSAFVSHGKTCDVGASQILSTQGPAAPHCALEVQEAGTPGAVAGKYWTPTPRPAEAGSLMNVVMAAVTACHLERPAETRSSIENDVSRRK